MNNIEKDRDSRVIAVIALVVAVVGLSIGFAAFTKDLNITFSESNVNVSGELDIKFLASNNVNDTSTTVNGITESILGDNAGDILVNSATISSNRTTISGLGATFNDKDQMFYYEFYVYNNSEYDAYLKSIDFLNYDNTNANKICTALEGTTQSLVDAACEDIHVAIEYGEEEILDTSKSNFTSVKIPKGEFMVLRVGVIYFGDITNESFFGTNDSALLPNGDFKVNFGDIKFYFSSLEE